MKNIHGGDIYGYNNIIDFSSNINPLGVSERVKRAVREGISHIDKYPDTECTLLREKIAEKEGVSPCNIVCGNGAVEIIFNITLAVKPKRVLLIAPSFAEYERAVDSVGAEKIFYTLGEDFRVKEDILSLSDNIDMCFICSPNNPTGLSVKEDILNKTIKKAEENNFILVLDSCFLDFRENNPNFKSNRLFTIKSLTKMYAIPGLRLGYGIGDSKLIEKIYNIRYPWSVSALAQRAGIEALSDIELPEKTRDCILRERDYLFNGLDRLNIKYIKSEVNFILFYSVKGLKEALIKKGILIRDCSNYRGLSPGWYRIAVKSREENKRLLKALTEVLGG